MFHRISYALCFVTGRGASRIVAWLTEKSRAIPVHQPRLSTSPLGWPTPPHPKALTMKKVSTAPSGAANENIKSRRRIIGGERWRDMSVVVNPRAVGPTFHTISTCDRGWRGQRDSPL